MPAARVCISPIINALLSDPSMKRSFVSLLLILLVLSSWAEAQSPAPAERRAVAAVRITDVDVIRLDGRLDEEAWQRGVPAANFRQIDPDNGSPASEATEVRILFSRDALYLGVTCFDSEPEK